MMYLDLGCPDVGRYRTLDLLKEAENDRLANLARGASRSTQKPTARRLFVIPPAAWLVSLIIRRMQSGLIPASKGLP
jgi:hypothetical protein